MTTQSLIPHHIHALKQTLFNLNQSMVSWVLKTQAELDLKPDALTNPIERITIQFENKHFKGPITEKSDLSLKDTYKICHISEIFLLKPPHLGNCPDSLLPYPLESLSTFLLRGIFSPSHFRLSIYVSIYDKNKQCVRYNKWSYIHN
jgi:hypothetical protein